MLEIDISELKKIAETGKAVLYKLWRLDSLWVPRSVISEDGNTCKVSKDFKFSVDSEGKKLTFRGIELCEEYGLDAEACE